MSLSAETGEDGDVPLDDASAPLPGSTDRLMYLPLLIGSGGQT